MNKNEALVDAAISLCVSAGRAKRHSNELQQTATAAALIANDLERQAWRAIAAAAAAKKIEPDTLPKSLDEALKAVRGS